MKNQKSVWVTKDKSLSLTLTLNTWNNSDWSSNMSRLHPSTHSKTAGIGSNPHNPTIGLGGYRKWMDGWSSRTIYMKTSTNISDSTLGYLVFTPFYSVSCRYLYLSITWKVAKSQISQKTLLMKWWSLVGFLTVDPLTSKRMSGGGGCMCSVRSRGC